jgi:hypothetical protein
MPCEHQSLHWNRDRVVASPRVLLDCKLQLTRDVSLSVLLRLELSLGLVVFCQVGGKAHKLIDLTADIVRIKVRYKGSMVDKNKEIFAEPTKIKFVLDAASMSMITKLYSPRISCCTYSGSGKTKKI